MELRSGYKKTEVGVLPEDWEETAICQVAILESGHTPSKRVPAYWGGPIPWVSLHDSAGLDGPQISSTSQLVTQDGINNSSARILPAGTVVFSRTATVGKSTIISRPMATSQDFANYICGPKLSNTFLVYLFRSMGRTWRSLMAGSIHNTIYMPVFKSLKIPLPPLPEQRAIAAALSDVDSALSGLERLIAKKRDLKQAVVQQLLTGKTRLPGFGSKVPRYKPSAIGDIPEDWDAVRIGDLFTFKNGLNKAKQFFGYGTPIINYMDVFKQPAIRMSKITGRVDVNAAELKAYEVRKGDVFFTRTSETPDEIGVTSVLLDETKSTVFSGFVLRARPIDQRLDINFMAYCFTPRYFRQQVIARASYTTRALTNGGLLSAALLATPPRSEQKAIAAVLSDVDAELTSLQMQRDKIRMIKQAMMQELLTGRIRLPIPVEAPEVKYG
ncbi:restriction endonuclease subunit S [Rhizobium leguminosarum]|uniref:restriction endonuclease subunit S n=1 Tax=Rhizobium leguminosarum TaxID=384 RepID=UPI003F9C74A0